MEMAEVRQCFKVVTVREGESRVPLAKLARIGVTIGGGKGPRSGLGYVAEKGREAREEF